MTIKQINGTYKGLVTIITLFLLTAFMLPLIYGVSVSLKSKEQLSSLNHSPIPMAPETFDYNGKKCDILMVPMADGSKKPMAVIKKGRDSSTFIDPQNPALGPQEFEVKWRSLENKWRVDFKFENYIKGWKSVNFLLLFKNTLFYALITTFGTLFSSTLVAYGFSRFKFPGKQQFFIILIATIVLPSAVTLIPVYTIFYKLGWVGTWAPLIVPHFFANAYNVFLLRQFMLGIPREMDEAARIDGCGPIATLYKIILPQVVPAIISVGLFHFFWAWNDFFNPLLYLAGHPDKYPISIGLSAFSNMYSTETHLVQATSMIACIVPFIIFIVAQKFFIEGVVVSGVEK
ncbi:MAG: carbohydrate ABC transporter permease [Treponema sp.]|nr:carbohydrate ABC transporter permease [Candidatus Treponema equifaecale]